MQLQHLGPPRLNGLVDGETVRSSQGFSEIDSDRSAEGSSVLSSRSGAVWLSPQVQAVAKALLLLASCSSPTKTINDVVVAFFLLLDEPEHATHDWQQCRALLKFYGGSARGLRLLRDRMANFETAHAVDPGAIARADKLLDQYWPDVVHRFASEAMPLYNWTREQLAKMPPSASL